MRHDNKASRAKVSLFLKAVPHLQKIGNNTIFKLSTRFDISVIKLQSLIEAAHKASLQHGSTNY